MERDGVRLVVTNGRATAIGGFGNNMFHPSVEYYHPGMDTWWGQTHENLMPFDVQVDP